jgi:hypothetical protein
MEQKKKICEVGGEEFIGGPFQNVCPQHAEEVLAKWKLKDKIQNAVLDMMKLCRFDEENHIYTTVDGKWLQGVSTVSSIVPKDWLSAWGAKEAVKFLGYTDYENEEQEKERAKEILEKIKSFSPVLDKDGNVKKTIEAQWIEFLKEAKGAPSRKSKEALADGTKGHLWLSEFTLAEIRKNKIGVEHKRYNELTKEERIKYNYPEPPTDLLERPISQYLDWYYDNVEYPILSEARVCNLEYGYAGTLDAVAVMKDRKLALIDFKFATHFSEDYYLQTAGYQAAFENYGINFDERILVRLPKTTEREIYDKTTHEFRKVPNNLEVLYVPTDYETDKKVFFGCLPLKQWINGFKDEK